ncbi:MAG: 2-oxo acid dehydrogenase subunit E2 [Candidatus Nomurabacteria bacterium]|jgi:pyruvate/2-oxoglutarate dehydrogenase complex dihydrolipoamide acyltransferase (E2) component|nr:2-oxo acid dehydrogenase subunit E2 [Candidatus Nomurabacteria bacterium]
MARKRVRNLTLVNKVMPHHMPRRADAEVYFQEKIDVTELLKYLEKKNKSRPPGQHLTLLHAMMMATAKTIHHRPYMNRYIQGRRTFQRDEISLAFVARQELRENTEEMLLSFVARDDDTIDSLGQRVREKVAAARKSGTNEMEKLLSVITSAPMPIMAFIVFIFHSLDFWGLLPKSFTENEPEYATVFLANLGSVGGGAIYHHLNNFGTNSIFITMGKVHPEEVIIDGKRQTRDIMEIGVTLDERITDGLMAFRAFDVVKEVLANPKTLDSEVQKPLK